MQVFLSDYDVDFGLQPSLTVTFAQNRAPVHFGSEVTVQCNGMALEYSVGVGFGAYRASPKRAAQYDCIFLRSGHASHFIFTGVRAPTIQSPQPGARIPRSSGLHITFATDPSGTYTIGALLITLSSDGSGSQHAIHPIPDTGDYRMDLPPML